MRRWPGITGQTEDPVGKRVTLDDPRDSAQSPQWLTVIGVVKDVKQDSWMEPPPDEIYVPFQQSDVFFAGTARQFTSMTRGRSHHRGAASLANAVQETVRVARPAQCRPPTCQHGTSH